MEGDITGTPEVNKVIINNEVILDLTQDTVTTDKMVSGVTAHDKSGKQITGTKKYGSGFRVTGAYASARTTVDGTTYNGEQTADMGDFYIDSASKFTPQVYIPKSKFSTVFGDATIADVLAGASFTGADGTKKTGTMPNNGAAAIRLSDLAAKSVAAGYYSGGTAKIADAEAAKIIPENIKNGVTILGVEGTMEASAGGDYNIAATTNSDGTQSLAITDAGGGSSGSSAGHKITFPDTATNWDKVNQFGFIFADGTTQQVSSYDSIAGKTINNVVCIIGSSNDTFWVLRMTLTKGAIVQYVVPSASPFVTVQATFAPGVTPTPYGGGNSLPWIPLADTTISAIEMYNTD